MIHLRLFGGVELTVRDEGRDWRLMLPPKPLALLAFLAIAEAEGRPVRRDVLLALFWPELESTEYTPTAPGNPRLELRTPRGVHALLMRVPVRVER